MATTTTKRFIWTAGNVSAKDTAAMVIRTVIEHRQTAALIEGLTPAPESILEIGAGFGRMGALLVDLAPRVTLVEREPLLVETARRLVPEAEVVKVEGLAELVVAEHYADLVLIFTVLQHLDHEDAERTVRAAGRLAQRWVLLVEDTDPRYYRSDPNEPTHFTRGRPVSWYGQALAAAGNWQIERVERRQVEPGYQGQENLAYRGDYMLFRRLDA